ncbi:MAG: beta-galactosidase [Pirellulaceae bacterium]
MKTLIFAALALVLTSTGNARQNDLPTFGDSWRVAPSPDPERFGVESGDSLRFHGLLEIPFPASCAVFARTTYLVSPDSKLCLGFRRGKVTTDCLDFRYGFALFANGTSLVLAHHLAPGWNGDRGWTLQRTVRSGDGQPNLDQQTVFDLRDELIASYPTKFSMPTFFDNPENLTLELSSKSLQITRNGVSKTVACEISGEYEVVFFVAGDFHPVNLDFEITELTAVGTPGQKEPQMGFSGYLASVNIVNTLKGVPPVEEFDPAKAVKATLNDTNLLGVTLRGGWPAKRWYEYVDESKGIGYNTISLDIPWGQVERQPGVFDFARFDDLIAYAANRGYYLQLKPWWVRTSYPMWVRPDLEQECHPAEGKTWAPQLTFADPELTKRIAQYAGEIARRYRGYPNVVYTPVCGPSAEMEYSHGQYCDYGRAATVRFAGWLEKKYKNIATLNQVWGSKHADFAAAQAPHLGNKATRDLPDLDPAYLDFMAFREDMLKEFMTSIYTAMKAADPACQLGIQVGRTHDGPMVVKRGTPGIHFWGQPYEWIIADPQPQDRSDSAGYIVDFIRSGGKTAGVEQTTYESYANEPAVFWEFTWQAWQHGAPLMLIANCAPHADAQGVHTSRRSAEQIGKVAKVDRPMTAMFISKWELYAWDGGQRWLDLRNAYKRLSDDSKLVIDVVNGDIIRNLPGLLDHYATIIVPFADVIDAQEKAALDAHADKLVIESPQIYAKSVLRR